MRHYLKDELYQLIKTDDRIFDFLQEGAMDGLWYWDLENPEHEWMNKRFWEILGYDPEMMPHKASAWQDIINKENLALANENFIQHINNPDHPYDQEVRYQHKNGSTVWVRCRGKAIRDKDGKPIRMLGVHQDITALKEAEKKVRESDERFRTIFDNAPIMIDAFDDTGKCVLWNKQCEKTLGYTIEEINEAKNSFALFYPDKKIRDQVMSTIITNPDKKFREWTPKAKNGEAVPSLWANFRVSENMTISMGVDISKRKSVEKKLMENEAMLRNIVENSTSVIYSHDTNHVINYLSPQIKEILGYSQEEAMVNWEYLLSDNPINKIGIKKTVQAIETGKQQHPFELEVRHKNGENILIEVREAPVVKDGKTVSVIGIFNDISERKRNELELVKAKKRAEESERLKSAFLSNMSHEIRTPMNGILGFTELLKEPDLSGERKDKYIEIIRKSGDRMLDTVNDIIDISKIDAGQMEVSHNSVNIIEEVETLYEFFREEARAKGIEMQLICNLKPDENSFISDKNKLNSIISNLIKNAIKYTDAGTIKISCSKSESTLHLSVSDTGIGIPTKRINSIFNRFEQADIGDTHAREGSGLGLAISKAYVEMLRGNIGVNSGIGEGSTFFFSIPWVQADVSQKNNPDTTNSDTKESPQYNILIAEDDDISFQHLEIILSNITNKITRAKNGFEAIKQLKKDPETDLILMDIKMPELDGLSATKEIRKFNKEIFIIAQTANALEGDKEKAIAAGCNDYITKPIVKKKLLELVEKYITK